MTKEGWGCFEPEKFKEHRPTAYQEIANEQGGKDLIKIKNNCEILRSDNEWVLVEDIVVEGCDPNLTVYNLSVANDKTFVANNYIVHNKGGGGDDGSYICTAAYANGVTDYSTFSANRKYGINLRRNDPYLMKGYDLVGPTLANMLGGTKVAKVLTNYYKMDLDKKVVSFRYKLLQIFLKGVMRPAVRTIGYLNERIFK